MDMVGTFFMALTTTVAVSAQVIPTEVFGAHAYQAPFETFSPLHASDAELARYGFPPRPSDPNRLSRWNHAMSRAIHRLAPEPRIIPNVRMAPADNTIWSGMIVPSGAGSYGQSSIEHVEAEWEVPLASPARGDATCSTGYYTVANWVGIDGYGGTTDGPFYPSDSLWQAGTMSYQLPSGCSPLYAFVYEWWPAGQVGVSVGIGVGQIVFVEVWSTNSTTGEVFFLNETTGDYTQVQVDAPSGPCSYGNGTGNQPCVLTGTSAEWIIENPLIGGKQQNFGNYIINYWSAAYAGTFGGTQLEPGSSGAQALYLVDSSGTVISWPLVLAPWNDMILFQSAVFPQWTCGSPAYCDWELEK